MEKDIGRPKKKKKKPKKQEQTPKQQQNTRKTQNTDLKVPFHQFKCVKLVLRKK